jgi:hypothetical protein
MRKLTPFNLKVATVGFPILGAVVTAIWTVYLYMQNDFRQRSKDSQIRLLEARKSFLDRKTKLILRYGNLTGKLERQRRKGVRPTLSRNTA